MYCDINESFNININRPIWILYTYIKNLLNNGKPKKQIDFRQQRVYYKKKLYRLQI